MLSLSSVSDSKSIKTYAKAKTNRILLNDVRPTRFSENYLDEMRAKPLMHKGCNN